MSKRTFTSELSHLEKRAVLVARKARTFSLPLISGFQVGTAVLTKTGSFYPGANVEESAFNTSLHAEPCAIGSANARGDRDIVTIVVCADDLVHPDAVVYPCMHCWQFIYNFSEVIDRSIKIICVRSESHVVEILKSDDQPPEPLSFSSIGIDLCKWRK